MNRQWEQRGKGDDELIEIFYQGVPQLGTPKATRLVGDDFNDMKLGEHRQFTGQTVLVRVA